MSLALSVACGSPPAGPSNSGDFLPLVAGVYVVEFSGSELVSIGNGPTMAGCPGITGTGLHVVSTEIDVTNESGVWRGRPRAAAAGSFEFRFSPGALGPGAPGGGPGVTASASGTVISTLPYVPGDPVPDSRAVFGAGATLNGGLSQDGRVGSGLVSGSFTLGNSSGTTISCNSGTVSWLISRGG